jgi:hypothetical protein
VKLHSTMSLIVAGIVAKIYIAKCEEEDRGGMAEEHVRTRQLREI